MDKIALLLNFLELTPLAPIAAELKKDLSDGKIELPEGLELVQVVAQTVEKLSDVGDPEARLAEKIAKAVEEFVAEKHPAASSPA